MFKEFEIMKTLRYLLIAVMMLSVLSLSAQNMAQQPNSTFQSTSTMVGTGSALPQAAQTGAYVTGSTPGSYSPAYTPGIRKGWGSGEGGEPGAGGEGGEPGDWHEPWEDPIGDAMLPLMLLAGAYLIMRVARKRQRVGTR